MPRPSKFFPAGAPRRSKLALRLPPGSTQSISNLTLPAISNAHSILIELFCNWNSKHGPSATNAYLFLSNATAMEYMALHFVQTSNQISNVVRSAVGGFDSSTRIPYPADGTRAGCVSILLDRTNSRKIIFENGAIQANDPIGAVNPDFTAANNRFYIDPGVAVPVDLDNIITRVTVLSSVPATYFADEMKWQHDFPMNGLHPNIQAAVVNVQSTYDFEDQIVDDGGHAYRTILDHGAIGGFPLMSTVDLEDKIVIAEKCKPVRPPENYYVFDDAHVGANANVDYGFAGGKPLVIELINDLRRRKLYQAGNSFIIFKNASNYLYLGSTASGMYKLHVVDAGGTSIYNLYPPLLDFDVLHIVATSTEFAAYIDGQQIIHDTVTPRLPNLSGVVSSTTLGGTANVIVHNICGARIWEVDAVPAGIEDEIKRRVYDHWRRSDVFTDATLKCEWLLNESVGATATAILNTATGGAGPLAITSGHQFQNSRRLYRKA